MLTWKISNRSTMTAKNWAVVYDESKITTLSSLEHIRLRPGMYIGRLGNGTHHHDGIYILLKEIIDNSVDEHIMGEGKRINITLVDKKVSVRDYGRGIPQGKLVECVSVINTGAKYNDEVFQFSIGLNGVGTKAVNALSSHFKVTSFRDGKSISAEFSKGVLTRRHPFEDTTEKNGTLIEFVPDESLFPSFVFKQEYVQKLLWNYAYLNSGLTLYLNGEKFKAENGLLDLLNEEVGDTFLYPIIHIKEEKIEFAFTHTENYGEDYFSYVNGHHTSDGGTHLSAFREGLLKAVNEFYKTNFQGHDVRDGIIGTVAVKIKDPIFESQTKNKLGNSDVRWIVNHVRQAVVDFLFKNKEIAEDLGRKIQSNEKIRKELQNVKKAVRERNRKHSITVPQLKDCKYHLTDKHEKGKDSMVFLTEGQSAGGSMVYSRDAMTQAIFCLKGKPLNVLGQKLETLYKNEELYNITKALGIEESLDDLRYNKVVLATDADVDGLHIRNLLLTFFLHYFNDLVIRGHLFILETPLFRVRNQKETMYCYSDQERHQAEKKLSKGKNFEITRFKGLGEISPKEFGQFIGADMKLVPVELDHVHNIKELLNFYMGKNTEARRNYIMNNLV